MANKDWWILFSSNQSDYSLCLSYAYRGIAVKPDILISGICGIILFILSVLLIFEAIKVLLLKPLKDKKIQSLKVLKY
jgi:hypothetical protein